MIRKTVRPGVILYEKDETDLRSEALLELAELDLTEPDEKKRTAGKKAVLDRLKKKRR